MLKTLRIQNIALIAELEINFGTGLNVLTGETGAGKSIIIGSLNFILGHKLDKSAIRNGATFASVEAEFDDIVISRTLKSDGRSICRIDGVTVTAEELKTMASTLVNLHGQHETETLLKPKNHVNILDDFGGKNLIAIRTEYENELSKLNKLKAGLKTFGGNDDERARLVDMYEFQIAEIERLKLRDNEDVELAEQRNRMQNFEKLAQGLSVNIESNIQNLVSSLQGISHLDPKVSEFLERARSLKIEMNDLNGEIQSYADELEFDEAEFLRIDARLDEIKALKRKYGNSTGEIFKFLGDTKNKLDDITKSAEDIEKIQKQIDAQLQVLADATEKLDIARRVAAKEFEAKLIEHLSPLGMPNAKLVVEFPSIEFLFSANAGQPVKPLSHIISGGELSRFTLAVKAITAGAESIGTMVFDEIDTGISGIMGHKIAEKMVQICKGSQVIAVTHLAQIASVANSHFLISKSTNGGVTETCVIQIYDNQIANELKRMVGGDEFIAKLGK